MVRRRRSWEPAQVTGEFSEDPGDRRIAGSRARNAHATAGENLAVRPDGTDVYFAELWSALAVLGVDEHRAALAIGHLKHGLDGTRSPARHYGPVDELAEAVVDAFSNRHRLRSYVAFYLGSVALYLVMGSLMAFRMPGGDGHRVIMSMLLSLAVSMPMMQISNGLGSGYLLPASKLEIGGRDGFNRRTIRIGRFLRGWAFSLPMIAASSVALRIVPPNHGATAYLVSLRTVWIILTLSLLTLLLAAGAFISARRVPIGGDARHLLRDWGDMLHDAPEKPTTFGSGA